MRRYVLVCLKKKNLILSFMFPALIGALGAVGGGLLTANSIDRQNEMANQQFNANLAFQRYQYEDMKRWQSPANQIRMLREANITPALGLNSNLAGSSLSSVGGVAPTASHAVGDFSGLPSAAAALMQGIAGSSLTSAQERNVDADTELKGIDVQTRLRENLARIDNILSTKRLSDQSRKFYMAQANYLNKQLDYADEKLSWENQELRFRTAGEAIDNALKEVEVLFAPLLKDAQIKQLGALAFMNYKQGALAGKTIDKVEAETMYEWNELFKNLPDGEQGFTEWKAMRNSKGFKVTRYALKMVFDALKSIPKM